MDPYSDPGNRKVTFSDDIPLDREELDSPSRLMRPRKRSPPPQNSGEKRQKISAQEIAENNANYQQSIVLQEFKKSFDFAVFACKHD